MFSEMLSSSQSMSVPSSLVRLNFISCYIFKLFLYTLGFVTSHGQVERKLPPMELYYHPLFFLKYYYHRTDCTQGL